MAAPFTIRRAELHDIEAMVRLRLELLHSAGALHVPVKLNEEQWREVADALTDYFSSALPSGRHYGIVAEVDGKVVACGGMVYLERPPYQGNLLGREAYLMNMYTLPAWRRQGAGTAIVGELLKHARREGVRRVVLDAEVHARPIYKKAGFRPNTEGMHIWLERTARKKSRPKSRKRRR